MDKLNLDLMGSGAAQTFPKSLKLERMKIKIKMKVAMKVKFIQMIQE